MVAIVIIIMVTNIFPVAVVDIVIIIISSNPLKTAMMVNGFI